MYVHYNKWLCLGCFCVLLICFMSVKSYIIICFNYPSGNFLQSVSREQLATYILIAVCHCELLYIILKVLLAIIFISPPLFGFVL